jgi:predicted RNase H-like HicB family nuclease
MTHRHYTIAVERAEGNYSAYAPDLPGVVAVGGSSRMANPKSNARTVGRLNATYTAALAASAAVFVIIGVSSWTKPRSTRVSKSERLMREAIVLYLEELRASGESIPEPTSVARTVEVVAGVVIASL